MPRGDKSSYTDKQKRKAEHIEEGYEERGVSREGSRAARLGDGQQGDRRRQEERLRPRQDGNHAVSRKGGRRRPRGRGRPGSGALAPRPRRPRRPASGGPRA